MEIIINGRQQGIAASINLEELIFNLGLKKETVAVELNKKIIKRREYAGTVLHDGDSLEIVHLVGGGR